MADSSSATPDEDHEPAVGTAHPEESLLDEQDYDADEQMRQEDAELLADATCYRVLCPRRKVEQVEGKTAENGAETPADADERPRTVTYLQLFRFAGTADIALTFVGIFAATLHGVIMPMFALIFKELFDSFQGEDDEVVDEVSVVAGYFALLALGVFVVSTLQVGCLGMAAEHQVGRMRKAYLRALLWQDMSWYDTNDAGEIATRLQEDTAKIQDGIAEKLGNTVHNVTTFLVGVALGFVFAWDITLIIIAFVPFIGIPLSFLRTIRTIFSRLGQTAYARAGSAVTQTVASIRTVAALGGETAEKERYSRYVNRAEVVDIRGGQTAGFAVGAFWVAIMGAYAAGLAYGATKIVDSRDDDPQCDPDINPSTPPDSCFTGGDVLLVFFSVLIGAMAIGQAIPNVSAFATAQGAASSIFDILDRDPVIEIDSAEGLQPETLAGSIEFRNVSFAYPARPETMVLQNFDLTIEAGQAVALVGQSGSGKSTIVQLLMRFYDPQEGEILLDDVPLSRYNVRWLRAQMGLVSQEPSLFSTTIAQNILYGLPAYRERMEQAADDSADLQPTEAERRLVEEASRSANAHEFISAMSEGYDTKVGEKGGQLSGGQKQRVAIARAIIRRPQVLLLDEATSALDTESERIVQAAIDELLHTKERQVTSITIAHRLSTVTRADNIVVLDRGEVVEQGDHATLIAREGAYFNLCARQDLLEGHAAEEEPRAEDDAVNVDVPDIPGEANGPMRMSPFRSLRSPFAGTVIRGEAAAECNRLDLLLRRLHAAAALFTSRDARSFETAAPNKSGAQDGTPMADGDLEAGLAQETPDDAVFFDEDSPEVRMFWLAARQLANNEKRDFIQWWTGKTVQDLEDAADIGAVLEHPLRIAHPLSHPSLTAAAALLDTEIQQTAQDEQGSGDGDAEGAGAGTGAGVEAVPDEVDAAAQAAEATIPARERARSTSMSRQRSPSSARHRTASQASAAMVETEAAAEAPTQAERLRMFKPVVVRGVLVLPTYASEPKYVNALVNASAGSPSFGQVFAYQREDCGRLAMGMFGALISGLIFPCYAILLTSMITTLYSPTPELEDGARDYAIAFVMLGVIAYFGNLIQISSFEYTGAKMTTRIRRATYRTLLLQEMGFFDAEHNASGRVSSRLAADARLVRATAGERLGLFVQNMFSLAAGVGIAFYSSWRLTLIVLCVVPLMIISGSIQMRVVRGFEVEGRETQEAASQVVQETMVGIRTVQAFGLEPFMSRLYNRIVGASQSAAVKKNFVNGGAMGISLAIIFCSYALSFYCGALFLEDGKLEFGDMVRVFFALAFAASSTGNASELAADQGKAQAAKRSIFMLLQRISKINPISTFGSKPSAAHSRIEFRNVSFAYPARPDQLVLKNFNLTIEAGQTVALVGQSGSGKSTVLQLLMRFYDPTEGSILLDGKPLEEYNVGWLRKQMSVVSQEPSLFLDTIQYNILYGSAEMKPLPDRGLKTDKESSDHPEVVRAAQDAFAHDFIQQFKHKYATHVGTVSSAQLSGGQKQRVAIARALVRNPNILLLDEATSALDTESEREVQAALDQLLTESRSAGGSGRTSVVIAHRLSTIRAADKIVVLENGRFVEEGRHDELYARPDSVYRRLALAQGSSS